MAQTPTPTPQLDLDKVGQFQARVHLIEARELKGRDASGMGDPVATVQVLDQKKTTKTFKQTTSATFDQLMFFEFKTNARAFLQGKIRVTIMDANTIRRNVLIGFYDFDIQYLYQQPGHEIFRKWVALVDNKGVNTGFVKLSITVLAEGDQAIFHKEEEEFDDASEKGSDLQSMVMLPPTISVKTHALEIRTFKADHLPKMDTLGSCDGYVVVQYGKSEQKTSVVKNTFNPQWLERLVLQAQTPSMIDLISVQLRDWDGVGKDEIIATSFLRFSELETRQGIDWSTPRWINFYGAPENVPVTKQAIGDKMNKGELDGINFRGRCLVSGSTKQVPDISTWLGVKKVDNSEMIEPAVGKFVLRLNLYEASQIDAKEIHVQVSMGWYVGKSEKVKVNNGTARWFTTLEDIKMDLPRDLSQVPDLFVSVFKGSDRIGFVRFKASELKTNPTPSWNVIQSDVISGDPDKQAGFILFSAQFGNESAFNARTPIQAPPLKKYQLRAHIYQGKNLPVADDNGLSDPYVVVSAGTCSIKSNVIKETCFPQWYQTLTSEVELPDYSFASDIHVLVYDRDEITKDDFLGRFSVPRAQVTDQLPLSPKWYPIYRVNPNATEGEILASFQLIPIDKASSFPEIKIAPKTRDCTLQINVIGLRETLPYLIPNQNPFIEFVGPDGKKITTKTSTQPSAASPNFLEKLELPVSIPDDPLYAPSLSIRVRDDRKIHKPLLGARSLSLAPFIPWTKAEVPSQEDTELRVVDVIPGAPKEEPPKKEEPLVEQKIDIPPPEVNSDENAPLLGPQGQKTDLKELQNQVLRSLKDKASTVAESLPQGVEPDAPEPEDNKRKTTNHELELEFKEAAFATYTFYRAKKAKGLEGISIPLDVGKVKVQIRIVENSKKVVDNVSLDSLFKEAKYVVRLYVLEAYNVVPTDEDGSSNPYVRITCQGKEVIKDLKKDAQSTSRPTFFKCYTVNVNYPAQTLVSVELWDWDQLSADDLIGATKIDLETRLTSNEWKNLKQKPIEQRTLWNPASNNPQGILKMWVDILTPDEAARIPEEKIAPPLPRDYELRVIVWNTRNVIFKDGTMSDIFVSGFPDGQKPQVTDTHWRSENGKGSFNWRMKFPVQLPTRNPTFKLQIWDKDILKSNDAIAEANLNLRSFYRKLYASEGNRDTIPRQWIAMTHSSTPGKMTGEVEVSIELLSKEEADRFKNGFGRSEPNAHPNLGAPDRPETSFNPFQINKYFEKVFWKKYKWRIWGVAICCLCCLGLILFLFIRFTFPFLF